MNPALWAALGAGAALLLLLAGAAVSVALTGRRSRAHQDALTGALSEVESLRERVEELSAELAGTQSRSGPPTVGEYVITTAGRPTPPDDEHLQTVSQRAVLSATLGEPLVRLAAFGYGVRKALAPETRNRIAFEMRREVKRARKERRREARRARVAPRRAEAPAEEAA